MSSPERLVVLDVDGTLTRITQVDTDCYVRALADVFGFHEVDTDWSHYRHATDGAILSELFERYRRIGVRLQVEQPLLCDYARPCADWLPTRGPIPLVGRWWQTLNTVRYGLPS